jgi:hypothetical protein
MVWRVWARITGPRLPFSRVKIGRAWVGPIADGSYRPSGPTPPTLSWSGADYNYFSATAPQISVVSDCWIVVEGVDASDNFRAMRAVEAADIPLIVAALSAGSSGTAYRVQMVGADDGRDGLSDSPTVTTSASEKDELPETEIDKAKKRVAVLDDNKDLRTAATVFYRGLRYADFVAGPITSAASVLAFYQVLEACARVVPWTPAPDYDKQRAAILHTLRDQLASKSLVNKQATAVSQANDKLSRLDAKYMSLRIEHAANELALGKGWIERERDLGKFRNSRLGHASELPPDEQLSEWVNVNVAEPLSAYALASAMLDVAIKYVMGTI